MPSPPSSDDRQPAATHGRRLRRRLDHAPRDPGAGAARPERALEESFEALAQRSGSSVPTIMRTCRDLGFAGLREFKLALAQELALGGSPLHRRVSLDNSTEDVVSKIVRSASSTVLSVRDQLDVAVLEATAAALAAASHIDIYGAGATSWFMAGDLQARLFRLGLSVNVWSDYHLQQVAAGRTARARWCWPSATWAACRRCWTRWTLPKPRARTVAITRAGTALAARADLLLAVDVPEDAVMRVGIDAYLAHLTIIEILSVLVAQRLGEPAIARLRGVRTALQRHGIDAQLYPCPSGLRPTAAGSAFMSSPALTLLAGGLLVDGTGGPGWTGDVLIAGDRIAAVGEALRQHPPQGLVCPRPTSSTAAARWWPPASSTRTHTTTPPCCARPNTCPSSRRASPRWSPATAASRWRRTAPRRRARRCRCWGPTPSNTPAWPPTVPPCRPRARRSTWRRWWATPRCALLPWATTWRAPPAPMSAPAWRSCWTPACKTAPSACPRACSTTRPWPRRPTK
jgi:DNA-binding MurR/RpiR family transcriptional regulator